MAMLYSALSVRPGLNPAFSCTRVLMDQLSPAVMNVPVAVL